MAKQQSKFKKQAAEIQRDSEAIARRMKEVASQDPRASAAVAARAAKRKPNGK